MSVAQSLPMIALAGSPNCGKTALFNALTGSRQKVANYPGVTVERKGGLTVTPQGRKIHVLDLPGTYSLNAGTLDEEIAQAVLLNKRADVERPEVIVAVADATNLERNLSLVLELCGLGQKMVLALNMMDIARQRGMKLDLKILEKELGVPVVPTVAVKREGIQELLSSVDRLLAEKWQGEGKAGDSDVTLSGERVWKKPTDEEVRKRFAKVDQILKAAIQQLSGPALWTDRIDRVVLHPIWGVGILVALLAFIFQAIFNWASVPAEMIDTGIGAFGAWVGTTLPDGALNSLIVDGVIAGVGAVLVFLPQILLLFFFILLLEDFGYMARAAFLMDKLMGKVGLHGRAFLPLLSSYACAVPGIMATRTIANRRDRLTTILVAPLTTCSARLPVYSLLIAAFIPNTLLWGPFRLQGTVMFGLYFVGFFSVLGVALIFNRLLFRGDTPSLLLELPTYKMPGVRNVFLGLMERGRIFLRRVGTIILSLTVILWFLSSYPKPPEVSYPAFEGQEAKPAIHYSYAGRIGHAIEPVISPLRFDSLLLLPDPVIPVFI